MRQNCCDTVSWWFFHPLITIKPCLICSVSLLSPEKDGWHKKGEGQQAFDTGRLSSAWDQDTHISPVIDGDNSGNGLNSEAWRWSVAIDPSSRGTGPCPV